MKEKSHEQLVYQWINYSVQFVHGWERYGSGHSVLVAILPFSDANDEKIIEYVDDLSSGDDQAMEAIQKLQAYKKAGKILWMTGFYVDQIMSDMVKKLFIKHDELFPGLAPNKS